MLSGELHRAGLRAVESGLFGESHVRPYFQPMEAGNQDTVAVEINFSAVCGFQEAESLVGK